MKPFTLIAVAVFVLIAVMQLFRLFMDWEVTVNGAIVPIWVSAVAFVVAAGLAAMLGREARR